MHHTQAMKQTIQNVCNEGRYGGRAGGSWQAEHKYRHCVAKGRGGGAGGGRQAVVGWQVARVMSGGK